MTLQERARELEQTLSCAAPETWQAHIVEALEDAAQPANRACKALGSDRPVVDPSDPAWVPLTRTADRLKLRAGDEVAVQMDLAGVRAWVVAHAPYQSGSCEWVLSLRGLAGCYLLERVVAVKRKEKA